MPQIFGILDSRQGIQILLVKPAVSFERVDGEISDTKGCQVLEEMRSLAWVNTIIFQTALHDYTGIANMRPLHRNPQPMVTASPTSGTDQHVILLFFRKTTVQFFYFIGNQLVVRRVESTALYIDNILHIRHDAMTEHTGGRKDRFLITDLRQVFIHDFLIIDDRTNLKEIEGCLVVVVRIDIYGKLDLDRTSHLGLPDAK